jgi:hypothetical protein
VQATLKKELVHLEALIDENRKYGWDAQAVRMLERRLNILAMLHGPEAPVMWQACKEVAMVCNSLAMTEAQGTALAEEFLSRALALTVTTSANSNDPERWKLRAVTYNNLVCHYRRLAMHESGSRQIGRLCSAKTMLMKALKIEEEMASGGSHDTADTHLNLCTVHPSLAPYQRRS